MSNAAAVQEPTMEEILASIRRIVSDDEPEAVTTDEAVLDLTSEMMDPAPEPTEAPLAEEPGEVVLEDDPMMAAGEVEMASAATADAPANDTSPAPELMSQNASTAVASAFGSLNHLVMSQNARTLDDIVTEMMRPMLREWLDDNLPPLVDRLVKEEIQRISRAQ